MGGFGSGRQSNRRTTGGLWRLDIRTISRAGGLTPGRAFGWQWSSRGEVVASIDIHAAADHVMLSYRTRERGGDWQDVRYPVRLNWTPCTYGGQRAWWLCPAAGCGRRVAVLYSGRLYACRHCHELAYASQRERPHDRAGRRVDKLRDRLQWDAGILNGSGYKPKGMHWRTFERLQAQHDALAGRVLAGILAEFGPLRKLSEK